MICYAPRLEAALSKNPFLPIHAAMANILRESIVACELAPDERLKEIDMAENFGVSRTTVRQAFEILMREKLIVKNRGQGVSVASIVENEQKSVELRMALEPYATQLAAARRSNEDLCIMEKNIRIMCATSSNIEFAQGDIGFHSAIYVATKNPYLVNASMLIAAEESRLKMYGSARILLAKREQILEEHQRIFEAIKGANCKKAYLAASRHARISLDPHIQELTYRAPVALAAE